MLPFPLHIVLIRSGIGFLLLVRVPHGIICFYCPLYFRVDSELESECHRELHKCHEGESRLDQYVTLVGLILFTISGAQEGRLGYFQVT